MSGRRIPAFGPECTCSCLAGHLPGHTCLSPCGDQLGRPRRNPAGHSSASFTASGRLSKHLRLPSTRLRTTSAPTDLVSGGLEGTDLRSGLQLSIGPNPSLNSIWTVRKHVRGCAAVGTSINPGLGLVPGPARPLELRRSFTSPRGQDTFCVCSLPSRGRESGKHLFTINHHQFLLLRLPADQATLTRSAITDSASPDASSDRPPPAQSSSCLHRLSFTFSTTSRFDPPSLSLPTPTLYQTLLRRQSCLLLLPTSSTSSAPRSTTAATSSSAFSASARSGSSCSPRICTRRMTRSLVSPDLALESSPSTPTQG